MKINKLDARASQDITIDELPKQDSPNNSDLVIVQSSSLTEATSIQQLRNKILSGSESISANLGEYVFSSALIENNSLHLMDGSIGYKDQYQEFYAWLLLQADSVKQFYSLDSVAESFIFPLINNRNLKVNTAITNYTGGIAQAMTNHTHKVEGEYNNSFWLTQQQTPPNLTSQRRVLVQIDNNYLAKTTTARDSAGINALSTGEQAYISSYMYVRVSSASNIQASKSILANGTISMDLDYIPTDPLDVATKRYIDNKFLNYEIPLSFSINDIGKRVPYYKNAETNPVLIALDGTKYLIADYPDFDYETQEGFTNDGVYFWYNVFNLDILPTIATSYNHDNEINGYIRFSFNPFPITFNSKLIYNFLQTTAGQKLLVADGPGKDLDNFGFTILDANTYQVRMNANSLFPTRLIATRSGALNPDILGALNISPANTGNVAITEGRYLLKIKPDYMVAKIQQVGSVAGTGDLKSDRSVLLIGTGIFNTKQIASMDDLKSENIIVGGTTRALITLDTKLNEVDNSISTINSNIGGVNISELQSQVDINTTDIDSIKTVNTNQNSSITTLQNQVNTNTTDIASINVNLLNKQQLLINIPILATRINSNLVQNVLLGTPTILGLTGYNVNDYLTVTNNIIKLKNTSYKIVNLSGSVLANYVDANGNPVTSGTRYYQVFFRRPSTVTVAGTNANDILNASFDIKTDNTSIADCEYTFSDTFSSGSNDPFNIDGFVFSISNSTTNNIQTLLTRTGYAKSSFIRVRLG